ncbi:hypothetical protein J7E96_06370 [Streptomyces sp. ISL-96]|uniref:hypothetical protein n=1 Tax=Streptomyces sp. ISL-96 TaxID=2819191 RepID=UPI001BE74EB2|nr:hypothetical protein [Streptomyces sp. ISL-96]MBT2488155.1 hypothetical protein [Streptomyces sp. ISL-96]
MITRRLLLTASLLALAGCSLEAHPKGDLAVPDRLTPQPHGFYHQDEARDGELFKTWAASENSSDWSVVSHVKAVQRVVEGDAVYAYIHTDLNPKKGDPDMQAQAIGEAYTQWPQRATDAVRIGVFDAQGKRMGRAMMVEPQRS